MPVRRHRLGAARRRRRHRRGRYADHHHRRRRGRPRGTGRPGRTRRHRAGRVVRRRPARRRRVDEEIGDGLIGGTTRPAAPPSWSATAPSRPRPSAARAGGAPPEHRSDGPASAPPGGTDARSQSRRARPARACASWPSRRSASSPRTSASTSASVTPDGEGGIVTRADVEAAAAGSAAAAPTAPRDVAPAALPLRRPTAPASEREDARPVKGVRKMTAQAMVGSRVHRAARHRVGHRRRHRDDGPRRAAQARPRVQATSRSRRCSSSPRRCASRCGATPRSTRRGTRPRRRSCSSTTSTSASPRPPRAGSSCPNVKDADRIRCASSPRPSARSRRPPARAAPSRPTCPAARSPSPTSASSASTPARRSSTRVRRRSSPSAPSAGGRGSSRGDGTESIEPRWVTTLALSFDHRLVDGELGSRYLADVAAILRDPARALVWG